MQSIVRSLIIAAMLSGVSAWAAPPINTLKNSFLAPRTDTAINGYDTVAYITQNKPVKGDDHFVVEWQGAKWKFANQANADLFKSAPDKYAPQYGGYCAYGVATDKLVKVDPDNFAVIDGKLYLNYDADVQKDWNKDRSGYIAQANAKFQALLKK
jgi:YHS domain-containing protein